MVEGTACSSMLVCAQRWAATELQLRRRSPTAKRVGELRLLMRGVRR